MHHISTRLAVLALLCLPALAAPAVAGVDENDLPATATWYFHADLDEMRKSEAGASIYAWLEKEVFTEVREETGVDLAKEMRRLTAYAVGEDGAVLVIDGEFGQETRDKALLAASAADRFETLKTGRRTYYYVQDDSEHHSEHADVDLGDDFYFSFDVPGKLIAAARKPQMEALLANNGKIPGARSNKGALFVLTAERSLIQAGMDTQGFDTDGEGFESNILRNTRQVAMTVADVAGKIAIDVQLIAAQQEMADSLASIVRGLIALLPFSEDMDPKLSQVLQGTRVDVDGTRLKISIALPPESVIAALNEA